MEHLGYAQTHDRIQKELGIACALSTTIGPMFHYLRKKCARMNAKAILQKLTDVITEPGADLERVRIDSLAVITKRLLNRSWERDNTKEIVALGRLMVRSEAREIAHERVELARESLRLREGHAFAGASALASPKTGQGQ